MKGSPVAREGWNRPGGGLCGWVGRFSGAPVVRKRLDGLCDVGCRAMARYVRRWWGAGRGSQALYQVMTLLGRWA
jgi:hypothetical protein